MHDDVIFFVDVLLSCSSDRQFILPWIGGLKAYNYALVRVLSQESRKDSQRLSSYSGTHGIMSFSLPIG